MIAALIGLLSLLQPEAQIYSGTFASTTVLEQVAVNRGIQETPATLVAIADCAYLFRPAYAITPLGIYDALVVDCAAPEHREEMIRNRIVADVNREVLHGKPGWVVIRDE